MTHGKLAHRISAVRAVKWDIFCSVVDNFGDIGVTWRLAKQLVAEHNGVVRLWVDDVSAFARICPAADANADCQVQQGVAVHAWHEQWLDTDPADVVVEGFACHLPEAYIAAMAARERKPLWLNLEYLSAEEWVAGCHGLPSMQSNGLQKYFFFPGFSKDTGGLLREAALITERQAFQAAPAARPAFLRGLGVEPVAGARLISLFAYENPALSSWLEALAVNRQATQLLVPEGRILADVQAWVGGEQLRAGDCRVHGQLQINVLPFIEQSQYDRLLWSCDFNAVRGEDSFLRAQWAGRPMLWHIYSQEEGAHLDKLEAFLKRYIDGLSAPASEALLSLWRDWNSAQSVSKSWSLWLENAEELTVHAEKWCLEQASHTDLAAALVQFQQNWI
ncbi:elongation factor P maturation arginine rhamnosyltransferase EarP [Pseudomonas sp. NPDC078700]|uniref:elongation factor P maturation arginine rhamnosyltransferase EarP n=1 Tax=Pseudomonas sp. NPDC078700 TaxID=3364424 RepID=UPI0037C5C687